MRKLRQLQLNILCHALPPFRLCNMVKSSTVFPFSVILKSILKSLIFIQRRSVSVLLIAEPLSVLSVRNENQSLDVVLPFFIFVFNFTFEIYKEFLVYSLSKKVKSSLYSRYYAEACNEWRGLSPGS